MILLAVDPGLASVGFATFHVPPSGVWPADHDPLHNLEEAWELATDPGDHLAGRLAFLHHATLEAMGHNLPAVTVIETPSTGADYGGQRGRRAGTNLLFEALGSIQAAAGLYYLRQRLELDACLAYVKAPRSRKTARHKALKTRAGQLGVSLPTGKRGGKLPNAWDAVLCGTTYLEERMRENG